MSDLIEFHCDAVADGTLKVETLRGTEALSEPYRYELELVSDRESIDPEKMVLAPAWIGLKQPVSRKGGGSGTKTAKTHGIVSSFDQLDKHGERIRYRAAVVPALWKLTLARRSRAFVDVDVRDLIREILTDARIDFDIKATGSFEKQEFVSQYKESDFDFLSRWLEHEGIFYFFDQSGNREKVVFANRAAAYAPLPGASKIAFRSVGADGAGLDEEALILSLQCRRNPLPREVFLADWNPRTPKDKVEGKAAVDPKGFGTEYEYGNHARNANHARALARIRAEAHLCRRNLFTGLGTARSFRCGLAFELKDHYRFDGKYILTSVRHEASQPVDRAADPGRPAAYRNRFTCIPADVVFRPERKTAWPQVSGLINAQVTTGKDHAQVDDEGRYKVQMFYDGRDSNKPTGSHYVRMAQPHAGRNEGFHFPLHRGTEVLIGHANGDPDRPLIVGALPNSDTKSPVRNGNTTQNIIRSAGNNMIRLEDKKDAQDLFLHAEKDMDVRIKNDGKTLVGNDAHRIVRNDDFLHVENDRNVVVGANQVISVGADRLITVDGQQGIEVGSNASVTAGANLVHEAGANYTMKASANALLKGAGVVIEALSGITLKCGASSIVIDPSGVTIKGPVVTVDGQMTKLNSGPGSPAQSGKPDRAVRVKKAERAEEAAEQ